jgi:hypothetical protein
MSNRRDSNLRSPLLGSRLTLPRFHTFMQITHAKQTTMSSSSSSSSASSAASTTTATTRPSFAHVPTSSHPAALLAPLPGAGVTRQLTIETIPLDWQAFIISYLDWTQRPELGTRDKHSRRERNWCVLITVVMGVRDAP